MEKRVSKISRTCCILSLFFTMACASIITGQQQSLSVTTTPPSSCTLVNDKGTWYVNAPGTVSVKRAYGDMSVNCKKEELAGQNTVKSSTKAMVFGNVLFGLIGLPIGTAIDMGTGAAYEYPNPIELPLKK